MKHSKGRVVLLLPCQKFALFVSPFSNGRPYGAEIRNEFTLSIAKKFALLVLTFSNGATSGRARGCKTNDQIMPAPSVLPIEKMN